MAARVINVEVRASTIGLGLFASRDIPAGETILRIRGRVLNWRVVKRRKGPSQDNCYRFGAETYLDPGNDVSRYVNHSCAPNAAVRKAQRALHLFAVKRIRAGAEIVFDYSTLTGDDDIWQLRCRCGQRSCRKIVKRFGSLPPATQRRYLRTGMVPEFIVATLEPEQERNSSSVHCREPVANSGFRFVLKKSSTRCHASRTTKLRSK